jgi:rhodanese-related sulfurtransferase
MMKVWIGFLSLVAMAAAALPASAEVAIPEAKQTVLGKYLSAKEAYDAVTAERQKVLFLDVRTEAELMFVGMTGEVDVQVPFVELAHPTAWDEKNNRLQLVPHPSFLATVEAALARKGLGKADKVLVMCRSGDRSAKAVNALAAAGYANVWSVYDGFEGDLSKEGHRTVNGWKNAGLPWTYKLDKSKLSAIAAPAQ